MPRVKVSDIEMYYEEAGQGEPLLMTGGWGLGERSLQGPLGKELAKHYRVITQNHRNMGRSDHVDVPYTTKTMADDLNGLLEALNVRTARVLGAGGMGGCIGLALAIYHPDKVRSLCAGAGCAKLDPFMKELMSIWKELRHFDPVLWAREVHLWCVTMEWYNGHSESTQGAIRNRIDFNPFLKPWSYDRTVDAYISHDVTDLLHTVKCPTLVTCGDEDIITGSRFGREVAGRIPGAKLHVFANTSHNYGGVYAEEYGKLVKGFFAKN
ncbi:MAG: alpha/beta fold hydrolase [Chloroflexi bacterium]|nr:alpha/beta fold hydrolase [Chloroflexota bacterium]